MATALRTGPIDVYTEAIYIFPGFTHAMSVKKSRFFVQQIPLRTRRLGTEENTRPARCKRWQTAGGKKS